MKKAPSAQVVLLGLTLFFVLIAAFSFAAFRETEEICQAARCLPVEAPAHKGGEMIWDSFTRQFLTLVFSRS